MGWGYSHTPLYVPDPRDPRDIIETAVSHTAWGFATWSLAYAITGSNPGPGHLGTVYRAFLSRAHVGASYAGTNAFDDTMFALRVYGTPFRIAARVAAPIGVALLAYDIGMKIQEQGQKFGTRSDRYAARNRDFFN